MRKNRPQSLPVWRGVIILLLLWSNFFSPYGEGAGLCLYAQTQSGKASFYAKRATGSRTANGERLHHDSLTCAHLKYPFGTLLRVTNTLNGKQVVVRVNDRGPYRRGRIIDLSWGAAKELGMISQGIAPVTVERLKETSIPFMPEDDDIDMPKFEFELADIAPTGITPIWQQDLKIDAAKVRRSMGRTARQSAQDARQQTSAKQQPGSSKQPSASKQAADKTPPATTTAVQQKEPLDILDEINQKPNGAKAYLKRQGTNK